MCVSSLLWRERLLVNRGINIVTGRVSDRDAVAALTRRVVRRTSPATVGIHGESAGGIRRFPHTVATIAAAVLIVAQGIADAVATPGAGPGATREAIGRIGLKKSRGMWMEGRGGG